MSRPFAVINDTHIGVLRSAGTTPQTAYELRQWAIQQLALLLQRASGCDLLVNGDLFDSEFIPGTDFFETYKLFMTWLVENPECTLYLPPGNHDLSKTTTTKSSFQLLVGILHSLVPKRVVTMTVGTEIDVAGHRGYVIPHMPNQDQFDLEIAKVPEDGIKYLFVHCNYDNNFTVQSDHSLNLSSRDCQALKVEHIIFGHEHQAKMAKGGKVIVTGNQFPTSVADCIGNDNKAMLVIQPNTNMVLHETWNAKDSFVRIDWRELAKIDPAHGQFIRVEGEATTSESPAVVTAISKLRKVHTAFVITNATGVEAKQLEGQNMTMEKVANFNVVSALFKLLEKNPGWTTKVKKVMEDNNVSAA